MTSVFWYLDDAYLASTKDKHNKALDLTQGWHNLLITDESGFSDKIGFHVRVSQ